jgi:hypothetical protein
LFLLSACGRLDFEARPRDAAQALDQAIDTVVIDSPADATLAPACGAMPLLLDDFDNQIPGPLFSVNNDPNITMSEDNGAAEINFGLTVAPNNFAFYNSTSSFPLGGLCVVAEVLEIPSNGGYALLKLRSSTSEAEFFVSKDSLELRTHENMVIDTITLFEPDATLRFWRFRIQNDAVSWDLSADGVTYFEYRIAPGLFGGANAFITLGAGAANLGTTGMAIARFERITATGP